MTTKPAVSESMIVPPSTWSAKTDYGYAKTVRGVPLVRLEDVHAWLVESKDVPSASAAAWVFSVFVSDSASEIGTRNGATKVRSALHILDPVEHPSGYGEFAGRRFFSEASKVFPHVPHHHFEAGTDEALLYAMGLAAAYVWLGTSGDGPQCDLNRQLDGYCPDGEFQSHAVCKSFLGRLAVSLHGANVLWGWGGVAEVVPLHSVVVATEPVTWAQLVKFRETHKGADWTVTQKRIAAVEAKRRKAMPGAKGVAAAMAGELDITVTRFNGLLRSANDAGIRESVRRNAA